MSYVAAVSREYGRKIKAWDAIHLHEACRWSREYEEQVHHPDKDLTGFLEVFPEFGKHIRWLDTTVEHRRKDNTARDTTPDLCRFCEGLAPFC